MIVLLLGGSIACLGSIIWLLIRGIRDAAFPDTVLLLTGVSIIAYVVFRWDRAKWPVIVFGIGAFAVLVGNILLEPA